MFCPHDIICSNMETHSKVTMILIISEPFLFYANLTVSYVRVTINFYHREEVAKFVSWWKFPVLRYIAHKNLYHQELVIHSPCEIFSSKVHIILLLIKYIIMHQQQ